MSCLWKQLPDKMLHPKPLAKKATTKNGSKFEISTFWTSFTQAKTSTDGQFVQ